MNSQLINSNVDIKLKEKSDIAGYIIASLYSGSGILYLLYDYHLARCIYLLTTLYFVFMCIKIIYTMLMISNATEHVKNVMNSAISASLNLDFSFFAYHILLVVGLMSPFMIETAGPLAKSFAIIVGFLEIVMLASAKTLQIRMKKEQH